MPFKKILSDPIFPSFRLEILTTQIIKDSKEQAFAAAQVRQYMAVMLGHDERLCKALIPDYALGCRRMTPAPKYLQTLTQPNVQVVTEGVRRVLPYGLELASSEVVEVDAIICATGFDVSFCPRFPLVGRNGNLQDLWRDNVPQAYMSCAVPGLPNYFSEFSASLSLVHSCFGLVYRVSRICFFFLSPPPPLPRPFSPPNSRTCTHPRYQPSWAQTPPSAMAVSLRWPSTLPRTLQA